MKTHSKLMICVLVILGLMLAAGRSQGQDATADEAMKLATKLTDEGAATFSKADARAMAAYYTDDAIVFLQTRKDGEHNVKEYDGKAEIEQAYADMFKNEQGTIRAKNHVEYARLLSRDVLVIAGTFEPNQLAAKPLKVPFYQVRVKQGEKWLIHSLRIFYVPENE